MYVYRPQGNMTMIKRSLLSLAVMTALSGCSSERSQPQVDQNEIIKNEVISRAAVDQVVDAYTRNFIGHQPALATSLKLTDPQYGIYADRLPNYSVAGMQALQIDMNKAAEQLKRLQSKNLAETDRLHVSVNEVIARYYAGDGKFSGGYIDTWGGHLPYIVNQLSGPLVDIPNILKDQHGVSDRVDADNYLKRLTAFAVLIDQVREKVLADAAKGIILPKPLFKNTLGYLNNFVAPSAAEHPLVSSFAKKLSDVDSLDKGVQQALIKRAEKTIADNIYPAFTKVVNTMKELETKAPTHVGIWAQPNGDAFYQHEITYLADSTMSAEQIHEVGIQEVTRITQRMDEILKSNGYTKGTVSERMQQLNKEPRFLYEDSDQGREQLLTFLRGEIESINKKAPELFSTLPPQAV